MLNLCANQNRTSMKTTLLVVGRTVEQHFITAINDYVQRTKRYLSFEMEVIPELKNTKSLSMEVQKEKEGELILKALQPGDVVVLLDEGGKEMRSIEFADYMKRKMNTVNKRLVFIIGGPYGFSPKVYEAAHEKMSLSRMTFSHQMVRLIFVEQLYRAMTILPGAGGGGYLYMVAKDSQAALRIRETLTLNVPNPRARFVEMSLSDKGFQVSRS